MKTGLWISLILLALTIGLGVWSGEEVRALSEEYAGRVTFGKLNIDENADAAIALGVMSIPTLVLFKDGREVDRLIGMQGKPAFQAMIEKHLA